VLVAHRIIQGVRLPWPLPSLTSKFCCLSLLLGQESCAHQNFSDKPSIDPDAANDVLQLAVDSIVVQK